MVFGVALLTKIAALRSFSLDKLHYWRERTAGMSSLAYFLAKDSVDHFNTMIKPAVYLSMFYFFNNPRSTIFENYLVLLCLVYCVTGIAYVLAIYYEPSPAQLVRDSFLSPSRVCLFLSTIWVLTTYCLCNFSVVSVASCCSYARCQPRRGLIRGKNRKFLLHKMGSGSIPAYKCRKVWAWLYSLRYEKVFNFPLLCRYSGVWLIQRCGAIKQRGYDLEDYYPCLAYLIATGIFSRGVAFFCLVTFQKK